MLRHFLCFDYRANISTIMLAVEKEAALLIIVWFLYS